MNKIVCVTGCAGYVGSELVRQCLEQGWTVHGTVRDVTDESKVGFLKKMAAGKPGKLQLMQADLLQPGSFDDAVAGCEWVFHTASPFSLPAEGESQDSQEKKFIKPAVEGTRNVLQSVIKHKSTVKCVSLTSSIAAMMGFTGTDKPKRADGKFSEDDWNVTSTYTTLGGGYFMSKTMAEKLAWDIAEKEGIKLVTINPGLVMGPPSSNRADSLSVGIGIQILKEGIIKLPGAPFTDVRDVAKAHIASCTNEKSQGRYYVGATFGMPDWLAYEAVAPLRLANLQKPDKPEGAELTHMMNNEKVQSTVGAGLGIQLTDPKKTLLDMVQSMKHIH